MSRLAEWLREPDQFDTTTAFLEQRDLIRPTRRLMALVAGSSALTPIPLLVPTDRAPSPAAIAVGVGGFALASAMTWFWLRRWPTRRQSLLAGLLGTFCVAAWSLTQSSPAVAALACTAAAVTGGYLAFFHGATPMLFNITVGLFISAVAAVRLAAQIDLPTAVATFWLMWLVNLSAPLAIRGTSRAMSRYAAHSHLDPLTGLLNRRGFGEAVGRRLLSTANGGSSGLAMIMVDLDDFKRINDTLGHAAGDRELQRVAGLLRELAPDGAHVCRAGGEEFLIALPSTRLQAARLADGVCKGVRSHGDGVSASVGVVLAQRSDVVDTSSDVLIDRMIDAADRVMYKAKREGGDRVVMAEQFPLSEGACER